MADTKPNQQVFGSASQVRTANEIVESQTGTYKCLDVKRGSSPSPAIPTPFTTKGA